MSDLENKIKDLQHKLAVKKAFMDVQFRFSKSVEPEIREEVSNRLQAISEKLANDEEILPITYSLEESDIKILKMLAESVKNKSKPAESVKSKAEITVSKPTVSQLIHDRLSGITPVEAPITGSMARIMTLEGIPDSTARRKVESNSIVRINKITGDYAYVQDVNGNQFEILTEDLEINPERRQK